MCRKLLFLIAVLGLVGTVWADDPCAPDWRGEPGSAVFHWTYDAPADYDPSPDSFPRFDPPEIYEYWAHPDKDPPGNFFDRAVGDEWIYPNPTPPPDYLPGWPGLPVSHYTDNSAMQLWGEYEWAAEYKGRTGVLVPFEMGSWDIYNFWSVPPQPEKRFQIQMTWRPLEITEGWYECEAYLWNIMEWPDPQTWYDAETGLDMAGGDLALGVTHYDDMGTPVYVGDIYDNEVAGFNLEVEYYPHDDYNVEWYDVHGYGDFAWLDYDVGFAPVEVINLAEGWATWRFEFSVEPNPYVEFLGLFPVGTPIGDPYQMYGAEYEGPLAGLPTGWVTYDTWMELIDPDGIPDSGDEYEEEWCWTWHEAEVWDPLWPDWMEEWMQQDRGPSSIAIDQIVFDTICIPEPATIALLGLGGLALIRRRKQR